MTTISVIVGSTPLSEIGAARVMMNVLPELLCGTNARSSPRFLGITSGCRRFVQGATLSFDALFQDALQHKEDKSRVSYARGAIHSDGRSGVRGVGEYEHTV